MLRSTNLSFLDAGVDGVQQVGAVLVTLGQFGQLFTDQFASMIAHHLFKCWIYILKTQGKRLLEWVLQENTTSVFLLQNVKFKSMLLVISL